MWSAGKGRGGDRTTERREREDIVEVRVGNNESPDKALARLGELSEAAGRTLERPRRGF